ncbi:hypothetical protein [Sulfitobacter sp. R18_1]|uniref:hypothetical protein n=1 Tax=Sulfitobacter sp. R18_1 TaxID=2821104 RepID=UPI001ADAA9DB|nr:hypothetical protein [Sulfitobacter sp. R18_1]MBO9428522.1 hypothetical protein [Sulfitobacter sp. R18_1]
MSGKLDNYKKIVADKGSRKLLIVVVLAIIGILLFVLFGGGSNAEGNAKSRLRSAPEGSSAVLPETLDPNYRKALEDSDRQRIEQAKAEGKSALPSIIGNEVEDQEPVSFDLTPDKPEIVRPTIEKPKNVQPVVIPEPVKEEPVKITRPVIQKAPANPPIMVPRSSPNQVAQPQPPQLVERPVPQVNQQLRSAYMQQMGQIMSEMERRPGPPQTQYFYNPAMSENGYDYGTSATGGVEVPTDIFAGGGMNSAQSGTSAALEGNGPVEAFDNPVTVAANEPPVKMPLPGKILYATMVSEANSDAPGPIVAKVVQGELAGATLLGGFRVANDKLVLEFSSITIEETMSGKKVNDVFPMSAVAVDVKHVGTGIATDVDRHLFQRVAVTFATSFISGMADAVRAAGQVTSETPNGITTTMPELNTREQFLIASGTAAGDVGSIINEVYGNKPTTVKVAAGTPVGILFLQ